MYTRKYPPAYSRSLCGTPTPLATGDRVPPGYPARCCKKEAGSGQNCHQQVGPEMVHPTRRPNLMP